MFTDFYFYLIAFGTDGDTEKPLYFRVDRIKHLTVHRRKFTTDDAPAFDEGLLRQRSLFMWPGTLRTIRFAYTGVSVQAVLDKLPTARVIDRIGRTHIIKAEVYGEGIVMWLLSQGPWIKVLEPQDFVETMKAKLTETLSQYTETTV